LILRPYTQKVFILIDQPSTDDNEGKIKEDPDDSPTYLDRYKRDEQTEHADKDKQRSAQKENPLKDRPKWTDVAIVILTGGIVFLAFMQWREMSEAGTQTGKIIEADERLAAANERFATAMENSVKEAEKSLKAVIDQSQLDQRAWVGPFQGVSPGPPIGGHLNLMGMTVSNFGKTPALDFTSQIYQGTVEVENDVFPQNEKFKFPYTPLEPYKTRSKFVIQPGMPLTMKIPPKLTENEIRQIQNRTLLLYLYGWIEYRDAIVGKVHHTHFCIFYDFDFLNVHGCPVHNSAD
jgi:hypothetical protein